MKSDKIPGTPLLGLPAIFIFCVFTLVSISFFQEGWNPLDNYLSQLGNSTLNPNGAIFFNSAMVLSGLFLFFFYLGLYKWYTQKITNILLTFTLFFGIINALSIILAGVYSESINMEQHEFWSLLIFITFLPILVSFNYILLRDHNNIRIISYYGFLIALVDVIFLTLLSLTGYNGLGALMESMSVFTYCLWVSLISYTYYRQSR